ncbi:DEHA2B11792p [Debaryomyces hansenii CBS767]|uniref:DEHA2B11792p n=1 Tax=Debaryomyces hansenii (strain ATCC 36239 / CBS 767 / BCRC 21394 / JCM 1990 / NBRC 0083 / IGC 2968) TaxID=284592 RepID=Q6BWF3_DEBHA|nr:DEHA2B11792p [Debaryomyces hansenii CBS767]CAG85470.2 DEHA2B11792p [Debaryomyces hansenii CBS767]|eukprot:XP_457466.2 DEHA2B11792p [Debaryomyces hansenii CBS767]
MSSVNGNSRTPTPKVGGKSTYINLKLTVRLLPPTLTKDQFIEQLNNYTDLLKDGSIIDDYYVQGCYPTKPYEKPTYSRAYLLFKNQTSLDQFMKEINGKSFIESETNDSLIPAIGKSLYNKMPIERPYNTATPSKKFEDDEFYKEFLSQLEANTNESFDIVSINKKLKKRNKDKKKKERDPKKKEDKKGKAKEEKKPAKPKSGKATDKTGDSTKAPPKAKKRNRNKKPEGENTNDKQKQKQPTDAKESSDAPAKQPPKPKNKPHDSSKGKQDPKAKSKQDSKQKPKSAQDTKQKSNQDSSASNANTPKNPKIKIKQKPKGQNPKPNTGLANNA